MVLGNVLYGLAYRVNYLYLTLIGRIVSGFGYIAFMYNKRYCSDPRIVGLRRRTTLAGWLVIGQGFGFSAGPFIGGLLYKIGFHNKIFNGVTSPGWVVASIWVIFGVWAHSCSKMYLHALKTHLSSHRPLLKPSPPPLQRITPSKLK